MIMATCEWDFRFFPTTITRLLRLAGHNYTNFSTIEAPVNWWHDNVKDIPFMNGCGKKADYTLWFRILNYVRRFVVNHCCLPLTTCVQKRQVFKRFKETVTIKCLNREDFPIVFAPMLLLLSLRMWELANTSPFLAQAAPGFREAPGICRFQAAPSDMGKKDLSTWHQCRMEYHTTCLTLFVPLLLLPLALAHAFLSVLCKQKAVNAQVSLNISQHIAQSCVRVSWEVRDLHTSWESIWYCSQTLTGIVSAANLWSKCTLNFLGAVGWGGVPRGMFFSAHLGADPREPHSWCGTASRKSFEDGEVQSQRLCHCSLASKKTQIKQLYSKYVSSSRWSHAGSGLGLACHEERGAHCFCEDKTLVYKLEALELFPRYIRSLICKT